MDKLKENTMWTFWSAVQDVLNDCSYYDVLMAEDLCERYDGIDREYHGLGHIKFFIEEIDKLIVPERERDLMKIAAWFHDVDLNSVASSAEKAEDFMAERGFKKRDRTFVFNLIMATDFDAVPHKNADIAERQGQFRDIDWHVLGSEPFTYNRYVALVEVEYMRYPCDVFNDARLKFLLDYVYRDNIYWLPENEAKYGDRARENMKREIKWRTIQ